MDKSLLDPPQENTDQPAPSPMPPPSTPDNTGTQQSNSGSERAPTPKSDQGKTKQLVCLQSIGILENTMTSQS